MRAILLVGATALVLLAIFDGPVGSSAVRIILGILGLVFIIGYWNAGRISRLSDDFGADGEVAGLVPPDVLVAEQERVARKYSPHQLDFLEEFLVKPETFVARAIEHVEVKDPSLTVTVELVLNISDLNASDGPHKRLIPLARIRKGVMLDTLEIHDGAGNALSPLPYLETRALLMLMIRQLFVRTFTFVGQKMVRRDREWVEQVRRARDIALELVSADLSRNAAVTTDIKKEIEEAVKFWRKPEEGKTVNEDLLKRLQGVCQFFETHYLLIVEAAVETQCVLRYSRDLPLFMRTSSVQDGLRALLGLRPSRFTVPLSWPFMAGSYHFRISGEASLHISDHALVRLDTKEPVTPATIRSGLGERDGAKYRLRPDAKRAMLPHMQIRENSALPHGHAYLRNFCFLKPFGAATVVAFEEVPPGVLGGAAIVSTLNTALVLFFTGIGTAREFSSGLPAFLLALPAFAASWLGYSSDSYRILRTSLTARLGLIGVGVVSVASALLFLGQSLQLQPLMERSLQLSLFKGSLRFHNVSPWWTCLAVFSLCLTFWLAQALVQKSMGYFDTLRSLSNVDRVHKEWTLGGSE
ncbi:hypothetical protein [Micromonospora coerulea]|uniref:hypothetical protein n=1 Tax=Micromonospora coerulea TaxID=47856 RepID=UPI001906450E|nr:hypothetical protein [Micromonospora veneta]